jgi:uncharacterized phage-associated protein
MAEAMPFDRGKFKELVVYFCASAEQANDEGFGMVKLNKLLYLADFEAYRVLGQPLTAETYEKQEFGPVARDLPIVLDELAAAGRLRWLTIPRGQYERKVPALTKDPDAVADMSNFSDEEKDVITSALTELAVHGGRSASEWSHEESAGWRMAREYGDTIDYATAIVSTDPIPEEDLIRAREFVRERGWVKSNS